LYSGRPAGLEELIYAHGRAEVEKRIQLLNDMTGQLQQIAPMLLHRLRPQV
jgi:hypothetical protein